jgi:hypothetical protein
MQESLFEEQKRFNKKSFYVLFGVIISLVIIMFLGDFLSRSNEKNRLIKESSDLVARYGKSVNEMSEALNDTSKLKKIPDILKFFSNQKEDFPDVQIITSTLYEGQLAFLTIETYSLEKNLTKPFFNNSFYKCKTEDCNYLSEIFSNKNTEIYFWSKKDDYYLYYPIVNKSKIFVLLFSKKSRYGKFGS